MKTHPLPVKKTMQGKIGLNPLMYGVYRVDVGGCMSDKQVFRNQVQGAHDATLPGPARELECIMGTGSSCYWGDWTGSKC